MRSGEIERRPRRHNARRVDGLVAAELDAAVEEAKVVGTKLITDAELTINDDADFGCDPYNATGQHVILKQKKSTKK